MLFASGIAFLSLVAFAPSTSAFGPFGTNCQTYFDNSTCNPKAKCTWCSTIDGADNLCFSTSHMPQNMTYWKCSKSPSEVRQPGFIPSNATFALHQVNSSPHSTPHCVELVVQTPGDNSSECFKGYWAKHGYQFETYKSGLCPSTFNYLNLKDSVCQSSSSANASSFGVSIFTLGVK